MPTVDDFQVGDVVWVDTEASRDIEDIEDFLPVEYLDYIETASLTVVGVSRVYVDVRRTDFAQGRAFEGAGIRYTNPEGDSFTSWSIGPKLLRHDNPTRKRKKLKRDYKRTYIKQ